MFRPTLIGLNPVELNYYPFIISFDKCNESCIVLSLKICVPKETKNINVKVFNMIANKNEAIMLLLIITIICYYYAKFKSEQKDFHVLIIQKWKKMNLKQFVLKIVRVIFLMA